MSAIRNCKLAYECKKDWKDLTPMPGKSEVRHCADCRANVFLCKTNMDLDWHLQLNNCVALAGIERNDIANSDDFVVASMGVPGFPSEEIDGRLYPLIDDVGLGEHLVRKCLECGITTTKQLFNYTASELEESYGFGQHEVAEISLLLASRGYSLSRE